MFCPNCGKFYTDDNVYCVECGSRLVVENVKNQQGTPIERFSTRVKTSKPQNREVKEKDNRKYREVTLTDNKLDTIILQNKQLIKQNNRIIDLLEKLTG